MNLYGVEFPDTEQWQSVASDPLSVELMMFRECQDAALMPDYSGPGRYFHFRNICDELWGDFIVWHPDLQTAIEVLCEQGEFSEVLETGPSNDGKSYGVGLYALVCWLSDTQNTGILMCSTTLDGLKKRMWGDMRTLYLKARKRLPIGNLVDSKTRIQSPSEDGKDKWDDKRGIFAIAVAGGEEQKAMGRIIGFHPPKLIVIVDELTDVSWAIVEATTNLQGGKERFQFIGIGNAASIFDSHGKMCEPKEGWNSITVESERWETKRGGVCLHFDALKNPNVVSGEKLYSFLTTREQVERTAAVNGENSPQFWRMRRGFWCPEGTVKSIMSEVLIKQHRVMEKAEWETGYTKCASLDPAFEGGDKCQFRFGKYGKAISGLNVLEVDPAITIKVDITLPTPMHHQIARTVIKLCKEAGVKPEDFGMDVTGEGGGVASIIAEEWSNDFHRVEFGGSPTDLPVSADDARPRSEVYAYKVVELWYSIRLLIMAEQIRGLDPDTCVQLCARLYEVKQKTHLETKKEMKLRGLSSPDDADNFAVMCDTVTHRGGFGITPSRLQENSDALWARIVQGQRRDDAKSYTYDAAANL